METSLLKYSFDDLNINDELLRGIYSYGFENPSKIQYDSIPIINQKKDLIAQAQSGTGKTGSFCIGLLNNLEDVKETQAIVMCPTHELVHQCHSVMSSLSHYLNFSIIKLIGKTSISESINELRQNPQIIIGTPGRILDMINRRELYTDQIKILVLDEADEMLSTGFAETMYQIIRSLPETTNMLLFSATMPDEILSLTTRFMNNPEKILVNKEQLTLEGIQQFYIKLNSYVWKYDVLFDLYDIIKVTQSIIYLNSKNSLNILHDKLQEKDYPVSCIHGELTSKERLTEMDNFKTGKTRIMLSTDLLARGIDIQQLSLVINFDIPYNKETYIHRIGRSGRYGRKGVAINFILDKEIEDLKLIESIYDTKIIEMPDNIGDYLSI